MDFEQIIGTALGEAIGAGSGYFLLYCLAAIGLNLHFGYTGLLNFGQAGFCAVGGYGMGVAVSSFNLPLWLGIVCGIAAAVLLALILGIPTLRLRSDYLAIATIAAAEIIRLFITAGPKEITGGSNGLSNFTAEFQALCPFNPTGRYGFWKIWVTGLQLWAMIVGWLLIIFFSLVVYLLVRSPWGRVLKGIREDEDAVRSLGKNVYLYKMQSLILGGVIGAFGGFVFAWNTTAITPVSFSTDLTFYVYVVLLLGGAARVFGPILGAAIMLAVLSLTDGILAGLQSIGVIPTDVISPSQLGVVRFMLVGLALMGLMIFRPQGILGDRREMAITAR